ncbi:MAG: PLP-dependent transferase [Candidatus Hydrogenedens sp.]|nr:PLP-dependent transferase [Candidatus Hydrogenedens sp.]
MPERRERYHVPRDLKSDPLWRAEDLGQPIPDSPHATSVCLPTWDANVGYEEKREDVISKLQAGYPRFAIHPLVKRLWSQARERFAGEGESAIVLPSEASAQRCAVFVQGLEEAPVRIHSMGTAALHAVVYPATAEASALRYWQHYGDVISSRQAEAAFDKRETTETPGTKETLRKRLGGFVGEPAEHVWLYPSGMAALAGALRVLQQRTPGVKTVQVGFPYVDGLKMQTACGPGAHFFPLADVASFEKIEHLASTGNIAGVFCEVPGNPLLQTLDLDHLSQILRAHRVPLVVDDTVATYANVDVRRYADLIASSLTKLVSGVGDVMAGGLVLSSESPLADELRAGIEADFEDSLWHEDAEVLELNSRGFLERAAQVNRGAEQVAEFLKNHPAVEHVWYPRYENVEHYEALRKPGGGYGGLFSVLLKDAPRTSAPFFDALRISKGPSLGTEFSLACPYTLLAHYGELEWAESLGISRYLVRVSIGTEDPADLISRFEEALAAAV